MSKKLIVIGGPTASGKTSLAIEIAKHFSSNIISADSRQCYKELDIGVAKPSIEELDAVQHFFVNSHSIHDEVSAGDYERYGLDVLNTIFEKNDVAVCVGGTGLYIQALCQGMDNMPKVNQEIKANVEKEYGERGLEWLQNKVKSLDATFYEQTDKNNYMRLLRALIFYKSHGESILKYLGNEKVQRNFNIDYYAIDIDRDVLYNQINLRVDEMLAAGLVNEVQGLMPHEQLKALQTVGYKELFAHFNNQWTLEKAVEKIKQHTRNYAKRQITWFKNQGSYKILSPETILNEVVK